MKLGEGLIADGDWSDGFLAGASATLGSSTVIKYNVWECGECNE